MYTTTFLKTSVYYICTYIKDVFWSELIALAWVLTDLPRDFYFITLLHAQCMLFDKSLLILASESWSSVLSHIFCVFVLAAFVLNQRLYTFEQGPSKFWSLEINKPHRNWGIHNAIMLENGDHTLRRTSGKAGINDLSIKGICLVYYKTSLLTVEFVGLTDQLHSCKCNIIPRISYYIRVWHSGSS